jgi:putative SOS response-associated peptidase YedK
MMPVILSTSEWDQWLDADIQTALKLQRPWPSEKLQIVQRGFQTLASRLQNARPGSQ